MLVLKAENIAVERNGNEIFTNANIEIHQGDHIALIGKNGVGKTTFINCLLGREYPSRGKISYPTKIEEWAVVEQDALTGGNMTAKEFVESEMSALYEAKQKLKKLEGNIRQDSENIEAFSEYSNALNSFMELNGYEWEASVEKWLLQLGLMKEVWDIPLTSLSGGQKTRVKLAKVMQRNPSCLVLDEPTNHLDYETMQWLAKWLNAYKGSLLFISHERWFIDEVASVTYELTAECTKKYAGGYQEFQQIKEHERKTLEATYQKQQAERKKLMEAVTKYKQWFQKSHNAASERDPFAKKKANKHMTRFKAKEAALERHESTRIEKPNEAPSVKVDFESSSFNSKIFVRFADVSFHYEGKEALFKSISLTIERGDRIAVIGRNGTGKTTLLNLISGHLQPVSGTIKHHPQLKIGYFMQELEGLDNEKTVLEQILDLPQMTQSDARTILACFLFKGDQVFKKVKELSMGEKCRVAFVKLYFSEANLLVLDEPTNYLDIETREKIEEALSVYPGSVVTVSHDSYMLGKIANRVFSLDNVFYDYQGSYTEWKQHTHRTMDGQRINNEVERLNLQLTNLMAIEIEPGDEQNVKDLHLKIKELKEKISELENQKIE